MYLKNLKKFFIATVASMLAFTLIGVKENKVVNAASMTYAFATGEEALQYAPTISAPTSRPATDPTWLYGEHLFDTTVDLTNATYLAVEMEMITNNPALCIGVLSQGQRFAEYIGTAGTMKFVSRDGTVTDLARNGMYTYMGASAKGALLIPLKQIKVVDWGVQTATLAGATGIFIDTNGYYDWGFKFKMGEVGYYTGDPFTGAPMTKILDLSLGVKKTQTFSGNMTVEFPTVDENNIAGQTAEYPFHKGTEAMKNSMIWTAPIQGSNYHTLRVKLDGTYDLTNATYIAVEYYAKTGVPGITHGLESNGNRHSIVGSDGNDAYLMGQNGKIVKINTYLYDSLNVAAGNQGCLLIPTAHINYQFGGAEQTLSKVTTFTFATNTFYNYNFEIGIGEIGYYTGRIQTGDFTFHEMFDLSNGAKDASYSVASDVPSDPQTTITRYVNANFLNGVNTYMNLAYRYTVTTEGEEKTYSDVEFRIQAGVDASIVDIAASYSCAEWGIEVNGVKFNAVTKIDEEKAIKYVVISLGDVLNNIEERASVDFAVKAYAVINGSTYYSNVVKTYSVADMIAEYNSQGKPVSSVYEIFAAEGLYA